MSRRIQLNASSVVIGVDPAKGFGSEYMVKAVLKREADGTFTILEVENDWKPTSQQERECIRAGCLGCFNCEG